jgi:cytochrome c biogenesis protein CcmG, thiol:disulfide interchange protein DsbE
MSVVASEKEENVTSKGIKDRLGWIIAFGILLGVLALLGLGLQLNQKGPITLESRVPNFEFTTFDGQQIALDDYQGKVVVINFWASWCKPCEQEAAELEESWRRYQASGDVIFLGINYVDTEPEALAYLKKFDITYPNGPDLRTQISQAFRIRGVPETYFIDKEGHLADVKVGPFLNIGEITSVIEHLLAQ